MLRKKILLCLVGFLFTLFTTAQNTSAKSDFWNHVRFGGGIGLGFTNGGFNGTIAPSAIYQATDNFAVGTSLSFNYAKFNDNKLMAYGGSVLTLFNPIHFIQLSAEFEELRVNKTIDAIPNDIKDNYWSPGLFLGLGYTDRNFTVGVRYDVLYDDQRSIYANAWMPFVRVYF